MNIEIKRLVKRIDNNAWNRTIRILLPVKFDKFMSLTFRPAHCAMLSISFIAVCCITGGLACFAGGFPSGGSGGAADGVGGSPITRCQNNGYLPPPPNDCDGGDVPDAEGAQNKPAPSGSGCTSGCSPSQGPNLSGLGTNHVPQAGIASDVSTTGSYVYNPLMQYIHWADDYKDALGQEELAIRRYYRSRCKHMLVGSFGPYHYTQYDLRLNIPNFNEQSEYGSYRTWFYLEGVLREKDMTKVRFRSDVVGGAQEFVDDNGSVVSPICYSISVLDASGGLVSMDPNPAAYGGPGSNGRYLNAKFVKLVLQDRRELVFELVNDQVQPEPAAGTSGQFTAARLKKYTKASGAAVNFNYRTWTASQLASDPTLQWQLESIECGGRSIGVTYNPLQIGGRWVVSQLTYPTTQSTSYSYTNGVLSGVTHADGSTTAFTYSNGPNSLVRLEIHDPVATQGHRHKIVYHSAITAPTQSGVVTTAWGLPRVVGNGADEVVYASYNDASNNSSTPLMYLYEGGGRVLRKSYYDTEQLYLTDYQFATQNGNTVLTNIELEPSFASINSPLQVTTYISPSGIRERYLYSGSPGTAGMKNRTTTIYDDDSFETWCALPNTDLITRYRNRLGQVTRYEYDTQQRVTSISTGLVDHPTNTVSYDPYTGPQFYNYNRCATNDVQTSEYATRSFTYVPPGSGASGKLASVTDERGITTNYSYDSAGRLATVQQPPDQTGGVRATTTYSYNTTAATVSVTDAEGHTTTHQYDEIGRLISINYADGTSERSIYYTAAAAAAAGRPNNVGLLAKQIDRMGVVTNFQYDAADRLTSRTAAAAIMVGTSETATPQVAITETLTYLDGTNDVIERIQAGRKTNFAYDYRGRLIQTLEYPRNGVQLASKRVYENNQLRYTEDPYGRRNYFAYSNSTGRLIRTIASTVPQWTPPPPSGSQTTNNALLTINRDNAANAKYLISDSVLSAESMPNEQIDPRGAITKMLYDSRGRAIETLAAFGTALEAKTQTIYDAAGNVTEVRSPRYFDSNDSDGYNKAKESWTYTGRNLVATHSEAAGTAEAGTESFTYDLRGHKATHTDFRGKLWTMIQAGCCSLTQGSVNPLGNGSITNADPRGKAVHQITLASVTASSSNYNNPLDANTLMEKTTRYDGRGRPIASTLWLTARGLVDTANPPIAGLGSIPAADGLTTQYLYDDNLADGIGLDSSTGISYTKMASGSGTANVSLATALAKLADSQANGGAGVSFASTSAGTARVTINPQDEVSFSISDAAGRSVMSGQLDNYSGTANSLLTWSTQQHDTLSNVSGYGDCLEARSIDALGKLTRSLSDAAGRTIQSIDQLSKITSFTYDAAGSRLSVRDPNNVGQDCIYDIRGRDTQCTDTAGAVTKKDYDKTGNVIKQTDAKNKFTYITFDARGRQKTTTDRINGVTTNTYLATGQLTSLSDAENQTTAYTYDDAGQKLSEQYPDHVASSAVGTTGYGIITFTLDAASRVSVKRDQKGDTCKYIYDLAGRSTTHQYRTLANSPGGVPSGTISDTDSFTFDKASRMLTAVSGRYVNTVTYTYDTAGRKKTEGLTISGKTYTTTTAYNNRNELIQYTYPDSTVVQRTYTDRGELYQNKLAGNVIDTRTYDNGGRMTASSYDNGVSETRTYGNDNTLTTISFGGTGTAIGNLAYGWDVNKNKTSEAVSGTMSNYGFTIPTSGYDNEDRLVTYNRTAGLSQSWILSTVGDWNSVTTNGTSQTRTHGPTHELLTAASQSVSTDVKGNITLIPAALRAIGQALATTWDFDNRMVTADVGNNGSIEVSQKYDALGRRVSRTDGSTTTVYVMSGQQTLCDYASGVAPTASTYKYLYGSYIDEPVIRVTTTGSVKIYYHRNQQYSVIALTSSTGAVQERYAYTAYGQPTIANATGTILTASAVNNRYLYTGREWDNVIGQYHYRARMYDAGLGRFCSRDPSKYFDGLNIYQNRFVNHGADPFGLNSSRCTRISLDAKFKAFDLWKSVPSLPFNGFPAGLWTTKSSFEVFGSGYRETCESCCGKVNKTGLDYGFRAKVTGTLGFDIDQSVKGYGIKAWGGVRVEGRIDLEVKSRQVDDECTKKSFLQICGKLTGSGTLRGGGEAIVLINYVEFNLAAVEVVGQCSCSGQFCLNFSGEHPGGPDDFAPTDFGCKCESYFRACQYGICYRRPLL